MKRHIVPLILIGCIFVATTTSCDSDITKVYVNPNTEISLYGASEDIVLSANNPDALAMTLYWESTSSMETSDPDVHAPLNASDLTLQMSDSKDFNSSVEVVINKGETLRQFLSSELNSLLARLNYSSESLSPLFIRIKSELASNMPARYSNVLSVNVQPYKLSMNLGVVLASDKTETEMKLASPNEDGIYTGFMGVAAWYNWWFLEANDMLWGNNGDTGVPFEASANESHWNFWFPEEAGCYFVTLNTIEQWWSALHIDSLTVGGELTGEMIYNQKSNIWTLNVDKEAGNYSINISGEGSLYNTTTDTYKSGSIPVSVAFNYQDSKLIFEEGEGGNITVSLPGGETSLVLDLNNPLDYILNHSIHIYQMH